MEFHGRIIEVLEERQGLSARTGESWREQSFVVENDGRYPVRIIFSLFGSDKIEQFKNCIQLNALVTVSFDISAKKTGTRWYNDIQAYKIIMTPKQPYLESQIMAHQPVQTSLTAQEQEILDSVKDDEQDPF